MTSKNKRSRTQNSLFSRSSVYYCQYFRFVSQNLVYHTDEMKHKDVAVSKKRTQLLYRENEKVIETQTLFFQSIIHCQYFRFVSQNLVYHTDEMKHKDVAVSKKRTQLLYRENEKVIVDRSS